MLRSVPAWSYKVQVNCLLASSLPPSISPLPTTPSSSPKYLLPFSTPVLLRIEHKLRVMGERSEPENGEAAAMPGVFEIKARPYQREMMEESLKRNIIVAVSHGYISPKGKSFF